MINWQYYPKSDMAPPLATRVINVFDDVSGEIDSDSHTLKSDEVLAVLRSGLEQIGFEVERGKKAIEKVHVPVLFGLNGRLEKHFEADGYHRDEGFVLEVEAGRAVVNNQFLKDLFQASMMHGVWYLAIAVRNVYRDGMDFDKLIKFFDTLYASNRVELPLRGILIVGY